MKINRIKYIAIVAFVVFGAGFAVFRAKPAAALSPVLDDPAAAYKAKCLMCHSPKAEKFFNPDMPKEEKIQTVLKGKKTEKPPAMPGFEAKGMTAEEATALVEYMDGLRKPAN